MTAQDITQERVCTVKTPKYRKGFLKFTVPDILQFFFGEPLEKNEVERTAEAEISRLEALAVVKAHYARLYKCIPTPLCIGHVLCVLICNSELLLLLLLL